jgi:hypothetical protein
MKVDESAVLPVSEAIRRTGVDRGCLTDRVSAIGQDELIAPYRVHGTMLGDSCSSLRDLVAHVLMWDEINLAVLTDAAKGRAHWSLAPRWEDPQAGTALNAAGIAAGRELPVGLLLHRFTVVTDALLDELARYRDAQWQAQVQVSDAPGQSIAALAQYVMTVPGNAPYWHAAIHLGELARVAA